MHNILLYKAYFVCEFFEQKNKTIFLRMYSCATTKVKSTLVLNCYLSETTRSGVICCTSRIRLNACRSGRATGTRLSMNSMRNLLSHRTRRKRVFPYWFVCVGGGSIGWFCAESSVTTGRHKNEFHASLAESINVGPRTVLDGRKSEHAVCHQKFTDPLKTVRFSGF